MEFKQVEIQDKSSWFKKTFGSQHAKKSLIYIIIGAIAGALYFYFTEGRDLDKIMVGDIVKSMAIGGFFGFFITNSPCARNRC